MEENWQRTVHPVAQLTEGIGGFSFSKGITVLLCTYIYMHIYIYRYRYIYISNKTSGNRSWRNMTEKFLGLKEQTNYYRKIFCMRNVWVDSHDAFKHIAHNLKYFFYVIVVKFKPVGDIFRNAIHLCNRLQHLLLGVLFSPAII